MAISLRHHPLVQSLQIAPQVPLVLLLRDSIHAHRGVLTDTAEGPGEQLLIHEMGQRMKLRCRFPFRSLRFTLWSPGDMVADVEGIGHVSPQKFTPDTGLSLLYRVRMPSVPRCHRSY
jgi:hypothetical protein